MRILDAAVNGRISMTMVEHEGAIFIHVQTENGYSVFQVCGDEAKAFAVNNYLADVYEKERQRAGEAP